MAKTQQTERRRHPRAKGEFPVTINAANGRIQARVRDLSSSGICFFLEQPMPEMTAVRIDLEIPVNGKSQKISGDGAVVRCQRIADGIEHYEIAVFFTYLSEESREHLLQYVSLRPNS